MDEALRKQLEELYIKNSRIPKKYVNGIALVPIDKDIENFQWLEKVRTTSHNFIDGCKFSLAIFSNSVGNGKTTWATKIGLSYIRDYASNYAWTNSEGTPVLYINIPDVLAMSKDFDDKDAMEEFARIKRCIKTSKLVIFDDIATKNEYSAYDKDLLYRWIDYRYVNELSSIFTSNVNQDEVKEILGAKAFDRILGSCRKIIEFNGPSMRGENINA